jgi:hypothetical protein
MIGEEFSVMPALRKSSGQKEQLSPRRLVSEAVDHEQ